MLLTMSAQSPSVPLTWTGIMLSVSQLKSNVWLFFRCRLQLKAGRWRLSLFTGQGEDKHCLSCFLGSKLRICEHDLNKVTQSGMEQELGNKQLISSWQANVREEQKNTFVSEVPGHRNYQRTTQGVFVIWCWTQSEDHFQMTNKIIKPEFSCKSQYNHLTKQILNKDMSRGVRISATKKEVMSLKKNR